MEGGGLNKDLKKIFRQAEQRDWIVRRRRSGHYLLQGPRGQKVFCPATPSDHRSLKNLKSHLSKAGLDLS
jgi:hypothetical protein